MHVNSVNTQTCSISYGHSPEHKQHHAAAGVGQDAVGCHVGSHPAECGEDSYSVKNVDGEQVQTVRMASILAPINVDWCNNDRVAWKTR